MLRLQKYKRTFLDFGERLINTSPYDLQTSAGELQDVNGLSVKYNLEIIVVQSVEFMQ